MSTFNDFIDLTHSIEDKKLLEDFLIGVTTSKEREELSQRIEIIKRLIAGQPQQKIAKDLGVGIATVTRGSKEIKKGQIQGPEELKMKDIIIRYNFSEQSTWWKSHDEWEFI